MKGSRIVLPQKMQRRALILAHEGHQGVVRAKARLREKVWWERMDKDVEAFVRECYPCQLVGARPKPEPIRSTPLSQGPWEEIAIDLCGPLPVIDYFSRWPEVVWMRNITAQNIIKCLETMFATHGLPYSVRSDNGPQFVAVEFEGFLEYLGIQHKKGVPYWPQSNGEVGRFNSTMMKVIRIAEVKRKPWKEELQKFLFQYRTTPHTVTGVSPAEMPMGRKLRNKLPKMQMRAEPMDELQWQIQIRERDARRKRYEKEYADKKRGAMVSDIGVGDRVILSQRKRNKLTTRFEKEPYDVVDRDGNAVVIQRGEEPRKMRNIAHMKKLSGCPETSQGQTMTSIPVGNRDGEREPTVSIPVNVGTSDEEERDLTVSNPVTIETSGGECAPVVPITPAVPLIRPQRVRSRPLWMKDYVKK